MFDKFSWEDVQIKTTITTPMADDDMAGPGIADWFGCGQLRMWDSDEVMPNELAPRNVLEMWGVVVDLWHVERNIWDAMDARSGDYEALASAIFDAPSNDLRQEVLDALHTPPARLVLIDRVSLAPEFRGKGGIGRVLIGRILRQLICDNPLTFVVAKPFPVETRPEAPEFDTELQKVRHIWESIGFFPLPPRNDVWLMDSAMAPHSRATARLEKRLGLR